MTRPRLYRESTPIEEYEAGGRCVFVKRDDLFGRPPAPPLAKLRGLRQLLEDVHRDGVRLVGCWDTRVSRLGEGLAAACREFPGMRAVVSYPTKLGVAEPASIRSARELGAQVFTMRGNHVRICYAQARRRVASMGGWMLPFGLECRQAVGQVAAEAGKVPEAICRGTIVLSCGSGVTLAGLLTGLPVRPKRIIGLSSGRSVQAIRACVRRFVRDIPPNVELLPPRVPYDVASGFPVPFPAHPNYDRKAWQLLVELAPSARGPILFWNIGA